MASICTYVCMCVCAHICTHISSMCVCSCVCIKTGVEYFSCTDFCVHMYLMAKLHQCRKGNIGIPYFFLVGWKRHKPFFEYIDIYIYIHIDTYAYMYGFSGEKTIQHDTPEPSFKWSFSSGFSISLAHLSLSNNPASGLLCLCHHDDNPSQVSNGLLFLVK
jgi:hypothetical protein